MYIFSLVWLPNWNSRQSNIKSASETEYNGGALDLCLLCCPANNMGQDPAPFSSLPAAAGLVYYKTMALTTERRKAEGERNMVAEAEAPRLAINIPLARSVNS